MIHSKCQSRILISMEEIMDKPKGNVYEIALEWYSPPGLISKYANNVVVTHSEDEFFISFFEVTPPILIGSPEEIRSKLEQQQTIRAECVAKIIVSPGKMPAFINALQENFDKFQSRISDK